MLNERIFVRTLFWQLFSSYMYVEKQRLCVKFVRLTLMKLTAGRQSEVRILIILTVTQITYHYDKFTLPDSA